MDRPTEADAAALALALVGVATASVDGSEDAQDASDRGLVELVDGMSDVPLTAQQASIVETLGTASAALTAGLGSALAEGQGCDVRQILGLAAQAVVANAPGNDPREG